IGLVRRRAGLPMMSVEITGCLNAAWGSPRPPACAAGWFVRRPRAPAGEYDSYLEPILNLLAAGAGVVCPRGLPPPDSRDGEVGGGVRHLEDDRPLGALQP
ncbi:MAG: hypothetical protein ABJA81_12365, partial [Nocardioidaceae bacterium]